MIVYKFSVPRIHKSKTVPVFVPIQIGANSSVELTRGMEKMYLADKYWETKKKSIETHSIQHSRLQERSTYEIA
ncbi:uncharacterized protein PRCAT00000623001 [Priceomyces carsonii]|uniref:uncharacterized protein n=1 Tax=Priceomyces carsonii TaxID=28549 RepID=UPI002ED771CB|nr:unnamed protein product [Priceomyces carsonii]